MRQAIKFNDPVHGADHCSGHVCQRSGIDPHPPGNLPWYAVTALTGGTLVDSCP